MLFLNLFRGILRTTKRTNALTKAFETSKTKKMSSVQEMMCVISPVFSALFIGLWVLVTMGWVMNVDEIARGRAAEVEAEVDADADADEGLNQEAVPDADGIEDISDDEETEPEEQLVPASVSVPEHVLIPQAFESLLSTVEEEKEKTERMQQVIYQMLGGLYNHQTQKKTMMYDVRYLHGDVQTAEGAYETEEDTMLRRGEERFFTTRQGDENAIRIDLLENLVNELKAKVEEQAQELNKVAWNDNEIFMRMCNLEKEIGEHEQRLDTISFLEPPRGNGVGIKTLEERVRDLECMMSVYSEWHKENDHAGF